MRESAQLGRYRLGDRLGAGGTAEVFRAEVEGAAGFSKAVAVKRLRPELASHSELRATFLAEAAVARRLEHGNIVQILDVGEDDDGVGFLVSELVDGAPLAALLERTDGRGLPVAEALHVADQVAAALAYAHGVDGGGVAHRDVKPANILVSRDGVVKLADFGIARVLGQAGETLPGMVKGTLGYLSPEQAAGVEVGPATDQFALGTVLYEMLVGANPLADCSGLNEYVQLLEEGLPRLPTGGEPAGGEPTGGDIDEQLRDIDEQLRDIVGRAVAPRAADRFASVADLQHELERWRVARGLRLDPAGLRARVRALEHDAGDAVRLGAELFAGPSRQGATRIKPAAPASPGLSRPRRRVFAAAAATMAVAVVAVAAALMLTRSGTRAGVADAPVADTPDVSSPAATPESAAPRVEPMRGHAPTTDTVADGDTLSAVAPALEPARATNARPPGNPRPGSEGAELPGNRRPDRDSAGPAASDRPAAATRADTTASGRLKVNTLPYAEVSVDGRPVGRTPVDVPLRVGPHRLVLLNPDTRRREERRIRVRANDTVVVRSWRNQP